MNLLVIPVFIVLDLLILEKKLSGKTIKQLLPFTPKINIPDLGNVCGDMDPFLLYKVALSWG